MTQTDPEFDQFTEQAEEEREVESKGIKAAREAADRNAEKARKADSLERENALLKALPGVDLDTALGKMFVGSYAGELDRDAIRAAAGEVGLLSVEPPPPETDPTDQAAQAAREGLQTGLPPATDQQIQDARDPKEVGMQKFQDAMQAGSSRQDAASQYFNEVIGAAVKGDDRVMFHGYEGQ